MDLPSLLRRLRPLLGDEETDRIWEQHQLADSRSARLIELSLQRRLRQSTGSFLDEREPLLAPLPTDRAAGQFHLGRVHYGKRPLHGFALRPDELIQHVAIFGRSGAGKTNIALLLLEQLSRAGVPFLVLDWKQNFRDLVAHRSFRDLVVYTVGRDAAPFFFNPLIPPRGVAPREWIKKLTEITQHAYFLGEGVAYILQEATDQLYREFGVYDSPGNWPTLRDLLGLLRRRKVKGREGAWMESTLRALGVLCFGAMDWTLNAGPHVSLERLLNQQAVLELDALTNSDKTFLIEALLLAIHHHRMHEPGREKLKHVLVIEEAHHVLLKKKQELTGAEAVTDVILREVREFGEAIVLLDQLPSLISRPALENTYTTIAMNLKEKGDVTSAGKAMLLESEEQRHLGRLPVGWGIVKLQARWPDPFLVRFPLYRVRKGTVTDEQVRVRFLASLDVEQAARMMWSGMQAVERQARGRASRRAPTATVQELGVEERVLLKDIRDHQVSPVTERYARLGLTAKNGTALVARLVERGLARSVSVSVPGSHVRLLELTRDGRVVLGLPTTTTDRRGGSEHRYWVERIARELKEAGIQVQREAPIGGGKTVDLLVTVGQRMTAIEVETGKSSWQDNVRKCLATGLDDVLLAGTAAFIRSVGTTALPPEVKLFNAAEVAPALLLRRDCPAGP